MRRAVDAVTAALRAFPGHRINLLVGEPCFEAPAGIRAAFEQVAGEPASGYGPPGGLPELRRVLAAWHGGGRLHSEQVVVTHGAKGGLLVLLAALIEPGDEVIHPAPGYAADPAMARRVGGVPVGVGETGGRFAGWSAAVAAAAGPRTRAVVLSSPSNPSGAVIGGDELADLVALCRDRGGRLILDEAYSAFRSGGDVDGDPGGFDPTLATMVRVASASKTFGLCGWRIGWLAADPELARRVEGVQAALLNPPATPPQRALLAVPDVPPAYFETNRHAVRERLEAVARALRNAGFEVSAPAGGFYLWVDVRGRLATSTPTSAAWCEWLAGEVGVGLWPGEDFGAPGWVRLALPQGAGWRDDVAELERRLIVGS